MRSLPARVSVATSRAPRAAAAARRGGPLRPGPARRGCGIAQLLRGHAPAHAASTTTRSGGVRSEVPAPRTKPAARWPRRAPRWGASVAGRGCSGGRGWWQAERPGCRPCWSEGGSTRARPPQKPRSAGAAPRPGGPRRSHRLWQATGAPGAEWGKVQRHHPAELLRGSTDGECQARGRWRAETLGWCPLQRLFGAGHRSHGRSQAKPPGRLATATGACRSRRAGWCAGWALEVPQRPRTARTGRPVLADRGRCGQELGSCARDGVAGVSGPRCRRLRLGRRPLRQPRRLKRREAAPVSRHRRARRAGGGRASLPDARPRAPP